jgi:hypothetical protein
MASRDEDGILTKLSQAMNSIKAVSETHQGEIAKLEQELRSLSREELKQKILSILQNHGIHEYEMKTMPVSEGLDEGWWRSTIDFVTNNYKKYFSAGFWALATILFWLGFRLTAPQFFISVSVIKLLLFPFYIFASGGIVSGLNLWMQSWMKMGPSKIGQTSASYGIAQQIMPAAVALVTPPEMKKESTG